MTIDEIKEELKTTSYDFLRNNEHLNSNIILLGLGGSHAYGMNKTDSDLDIRGIALNSKSEILLGQDFCEVVNTDTDTTIYSFNKMIELLTKMNPNTCEILGLEEWQYLYLSPIAKELLDNKKMFLSKRCIHTFAGYASAQLRRLENKSARFVGQAQNEEHILKSINNARYDFQSHYFPLGESEVNLRIDNAVTPGYEKEIFIDAVLKNYPLRDFAGMWNEMKNIVSSYNKFGKRNENAVSHNKLGKHMAHLLRLYLMGIDILEKEEIITYRKNEHNLLMSIRNGEFLDGNSQPTAEFFELVDEYEKRFEYAAKHTSLPATPDMNKINEFKMNINEKIIRGEI